MMSYDGLQNVASLKELNDLIGNCDRCKLSLTRDKIVFGDGNPAANIVFVGEGPGLQEDKHGRPFIGRAGMVLDGLLEGIGLTRNDVFIANVVKCRPPSNRDPVPDEIAACSPFLYMQLKIIDPMVVCAMGNYASKLLTGLNEGISQIHGKLVQAKGYDIFPIYHPAAALYTRSILPTLAEDLIALSKILDQKKIR